MRRTGALNQCDDQPPSDQLTMENPHTPDQSAHILAEFFDKFARPVEGFAREELTPEQEELLRRLASGELDEETRSALIPLLAGNERAMEFLAEAAA